MLAVARCQVGYSLVGQVNPYLSFVVFVNAVEKFLQERLRNDNGQHEVVELVILVDVGKEAADNHPEAISCYGPGSMLP